MNKVLININNYYTKDTSMKLLNVSENIFQNIVKENNISYIKGNYRKGESNKFLKKHIDNLIELQKKEINMYISAKYANEKYGSYITLKANKIPTPPHLKFEGGITSIYMYKESELLEICEELNYKFDETGRLVKKDWTEILDPNQYCTLEDALELLNMDICMFKKLRKAYDIDNFMLKSLSSHSFYKKEDITKFVDLKNKDKEIYLQSADATKKYSSSLIRMVNNDKKHLTPLYMAERGCVMSKFRYLISDLEELRLSKHLEFIDDPANQLAKSNLKLKDGSKRVFRKKTKSEKINKPLFNVPLSKTESALLYEKYENNPTKMFFELCKTKGFDLNSLKEELPYTMNSWIEFVINRIGDFGGAKNRYQILINQLFNTTKSLLNILSNDNGYNEIYALTTKDIWRRLNNTPERHRITILLYLKKIHKQILNELSTLGASDKDLFNVIDLDKLHKNKVKKDKKIKENENRLKNKKDNHKDIYSVDTFLDILHYTNDINKHIERCIEEYDSLKRCTYASTWLTILIHLNNGWRLNDAANFKRIPIDNILNQIGIDNIYWFKYNKLTLYDSRLIISRVSQKEFIMTKSRMKGHYFCSDELACSVATAIIFLTLSCKKTLHNQFILTDFDNTLNAPTESQFGRFFNDFKTPYFKFSSLKMNKTLLTFIFTLNGGISEDTALKIASKMRGHATENMILHYLKIDQEDMSKISKILFDRGEFGFIHELLIINLEEYSTSLVNREVKNKLVENIKSNLCNVYNIEFLAGFFNEYQIERAKIVDEIESKTLEERRQKLTDIYSNKLISKEIGIHCFLGTNNCPALKDGNYRECNKCAYHIPSLMALKDISLDFYENILNYHKAKSHAKKLKLSVLLNHNIETFASAIETYGVDLVYSFMAHEKNEVEELFNQILEPNFIYEKYLLGGN